MHDVIKDISDYIFVADAPERADIIFIPGGSFPALPEHAARLWREGFAPLVMPTGKYSIKRGRFYGVREKADVYDGDYVTECEFMTDVLRKNGVPAAAILQEDRSEYTRQNAFFAREVTDAAGLRVDRAIIVCKGFHALRCLLYWQAAYPETTFFICPVDPSGITKENWFRTKKGTKRVLGELARRGGPKADELLRRIRQICSNGK